MSIQDTVVDFGAKVMNAGHRLILQVSGGRLLRTPFGMAAVELHTTGRKTGQRRSTILTAPILEDDRVVLVASKGGDNRNPQWYLNLEANPEVDVTVGDVTRPMWARTASPEEKAVLWPRIVQVYSGYAAYQRRATRDIPVVICEPR